MEKHNESDQNFVSIGPILPTGYPTFLRRGVGGLDMSIFLSRLIMPLNLTLMNFHLTRPRDLKHSIDVSQIL